MTMKNLKSYALKLALFFSISLPLYASPADPNFVTVEAIKQSLEGQPPMAVGFDVDETILFSSPGFYHLSLELCGGVLLYCNKVPGYWEQANKLDTFSLPKLAGVELVNMHLERGDTVYFITARTYTPDEAVTQTLRALFKAPDLKPVVFVGYIPGQNPKIQAIKERNIQIYYGDSDSDILAAQDPVNQIRGIRFLRAANTLENIYGAPTPGLYDEEVVIGSQ
jgi:acid phosphatase (class B)